MQTSNISITDKRNEIVEIIEKVTGQYLDKEYLNTAIEICNKLFVAHGELFLKGKTEAWSCGILHYIGSEKGLFNKSSVPHMKAKDLYNAFGVSSSTGLSRSKEIREILEKVNLEVACDVLKEDSKLEEAKEEVKEVKKELKLHDITNDANFIRAQMFIREAYGAKNFKKKVQYAKMALDTCDYCSDAYVILARDVNKTEAEKKELLQKAVETSKKLVGITKLSEIPENCWGNKEIEPVIGTEYVLASHLWKNGEREEAINILNEVLKHDKKDKLLLRSVLMNWLLEEDKLDLASKLIERFKDDYLTSTYYSKVVLAFKEGKMDDAKRLLRRAVRMNPYVIPYIIKLKRIPEVLPHITKFGSDEEAMNYMKNGFSVWQSTNGIVDWLKEERKTI